MDQPQLPHTCASSVDHVVAPQHSLIPYLFVCWCSNIPEVILRVRDYVHLVDLNTESTKIRQGLGGNRSSTREGELASIETKFSFHRVENQLLCDRVSESLGSRTTELTVGLMLESEFLGPECEFEFQSGQRILCHHGFHLLRDLFPHTRYTQEHGRTNSSKTISDRSEFEIVGSCKVSVGVGV